MPAISSSRPRERAFTGGTCDSFVVHQLADHNVTFMDIVDRERTGDTVVDINFVARLPRFTVFGGNASMAVAIETFGLKDSV